MDGCRSIFVAARQHDGRDGQRTWFGLAASGVQRDGNKRFLVRSTGVQGISSTSVQQHSSTVSTVPWFV